jgi:prenyltransferase beta subunit
MKLVDLEGGWAKSLTWLVPTLPSMPSPSPAQKSRSTLLIGLLISSRESLYSFLIQMKQPDGSFRMHHGGEIDIRGSYCAISCAKMMGLLTPELTHNVSRFIQTCQNYEGGFGALPGLECHGGYSFCALATLALLDELDSIDLPLLLVHFVHKEVVCL